MNQLTTGQVHQQFHRLYLRSPLNVFYSKLPPSLDGLLLRKLIGENCDEI